MINKRALIHVESMLDQEKIKGKENQETYHKNEKTYINKISKLEKQNLQKEKEVIDLQSKLKISESQITELQNQVNQQKEQNFTLKEDKDEQKAHYLEQIQELKDSLAKKDKNKPYANRTDINLSPSKNSPDRTKDIERLEMTLRNKEVEVMKLQAQLDFERESHEREIK